MNNNTPVTALQFVLYDKLVSLTLHTLPLRFYGGRVDTEQMRHPRLEPLSRPLFWELAATLDTHDERAHDAPPGSNQSPPPHGGGPSAAQCKVQRTTPKPTANSPPKLRSLSNGAQADSPPTTPAGYLADVNCRLPGASQRWIPYSFSCKMTGATPSTHSGLTSLIFLFPPFIQFQF